MDNLHSKSKIGIVVSCGKSIIKLSLKMSLPQPLKDNNIGRDFFSFKTMEGQNKLSVGQVWPAGPKLASHEAMPWQVSYRELKDDHDIPLMSSSSSSYGFPADWMPCDTLLPLTVGWSHSIGAFTKYFHNKCFDNNHQ